MLKLIEDIAFPDKKIVIKSKIEPQQEIEENKAEKDLTHKVAQLSENFLEKLAKYETTKTANISELTRFVEMI